MTYDVAVVGAGAAGLMAAIFAGRGGARVVVVDGARKIGVKILISGGGSKLQGLAHDLSARLELPVEVLDPFRSIKVDTRKFDPDYLSEIMPEMAVAVGLAMRGVN